VLQPKANVYLSNAGLMWLPLIALAVYGAVRNMDNLKSARSNVRDQLVIAGRKHTWIMVVALHRKPLAPSSDTRAAFPLLLKTPVSEHTTTSGVPGPVGRL